MAMGKRKPRQESLFVAADQLAQAPGHPFYQKLNALLDEAGFDRWVERRCRQYYEQEETRGRPSVPPGVYFRMLLVGYFEGLGSQRGIAWRCADSLALRQFLGIPLAEPTPDHSTLTNTRKRLPEEVFSEVFEFVLTIAHAKKLLSGKTVGVDSTTLEANAAMKSIVRRDTGEDWKEYVTRLMREEGVIDAAQEPTAEEVHRFDKKRKNKKVSNEEWKSPTDGDARITQMKDGRTHLAYKAEHVVDLKSDLVLAAEIYRADQADTATLADSVVAAQLHLKEAGSEATIEEAAADKGFEAAVRIAQAEFDQHKPEVVVASSRGGAVAMNINSGDARLVLMCPGWKKWGTAKTVKPDTVVLHSRADDVVPFAYSEELVRNSGLPTSALIEVGDDHRLADPESLQRMLNECNRARSD